MPKVAAVDSGSPKQIPLLAVTEFGYRNDTGTVFVVYADGTVICRSLPENLATPYHQLKVPDGVRFVRELLGADDGRPSQRITLSDATDQVITTVWTPAKYLSIYGHWREPDSVEWKSPEEWTEADKQFNAQMKRKWDSSLAGIRPALQRIDDLRSSQGSVWLPPQIEVRFSEYEHAVDKPVAWPVAWPGLYAETSIKHSAGFYSVYVPAADLEKLKIFLDSRPYAGAVMIDLNQMAPSMRFPFPAENSWLKHMPDW